MALRNCRECGHQVSTKAKTCPNCGARHPLQSPLRVIVPMAFFLLCITWFGKTCHDLSSIQENISAVIPLGSEEPKIAEEDQVEALPPVRKFFEEHPEFGAIKYAGRRKEEPGIFSKGSQHTQRVYTTNGLFSVGLDEEGIMFVLGPTSDGVETVYERSIYD